MPPLLALGAVTMTTFLIVILARAAWHKAERFLETVGFAQDYDVVPAAWVAPLVRALMVAEAATILLLMLPLTRALGGLAAAGLFLGYGLLMGTALLRGKRRIDCGCGGTPQIVSGFTLLRNTVLVLIGLGVAQLPATVVAPLEAGVAIVMGLVLVAVYGTLEKLASHLPHIRQEEL